MTNNTNSSGWITATGEVEGSTSNLASTDRPANHQPETRFEGGWVNGSTGEMTPDMTAGEYTIGQDAPAGGSVMDTVRSPSGGPIGDRNPNGKDIITVSGMPTSIAAAVYAGLLVRNHDGSYSDPASPAALKDPTARARAATTAEAEAAEQKEPEPTGVSFGEAGDTAMADLLAKQNPGELFKTVDSVLHYGDVDKATIGRMASKAGVEPEAMEAQVMEVWQGAFEAGMDTLADAGVEDFTAFEAYFNSNPQRQAELRDAARNFFVYHKTEGLAELAESYLPQMDRYEGARVRDMLSEAGYPFADKPGGGIDVMVNGVPVSWEVAVKQKIVTFSLG